MISPVEAQQLKTDLLQARLKKPETEAEAAQEKKTTKAVGKVAAEGSKMAAASAGAVDPVSQKAAEIVGKIAGEQLYKHRRKYLFIVIGGTLFTIFLLFLVIYLPIAFAWYQFCQSGVIVKGLATLFNIKFPCP